ncbi:ATP12 protein [Aphelenchoides avenae]|nr:ATP12 protein [Aphelenchus avenae]
MTAVYANPKKFYNEVNVQPVHESGRTFYHVCLGKKGEKLRPLKTQAGKVLKLESEPLALAVAHEWDSQAEQINKSLMRLTGLAFTAIDNPLKETKETITSKIMDYLDTDTLLYFSSEPEKLKKMQHERWAPVVKWVNERYGLELRATESITDTPEIPEASRQRIAQFLMSHNFPALTGLQYAVEAAKSVLISLAVVGHRITVNEAVELARLEQIYQTGIWGNVEWGHTIEHQDLCSRLAAGTLFFHFSSNLHVDKQLDQDNHHKAERSTA